MTHFERLLTDAEFVSKQIHSINDPQFGQVEGPEMQAYIEKMRHFLSGYKITPINTFENEVRTIEEIEIQFDQGTQTILLPICMVMEHVNASKSIRLYYSSYPYSKGHKIRPAILAENTGLNFPEPVAAYQKALADGDLHKILEVFTDDAIVREPSGGDFTSTDKSAIKEFYSFLFSFGGGAPLEHCTETTGGLSTAIEYNIVKVGVHSFTPQAGIAVYDWSGSKLTGARIYDDFEPPIN